MLNDLYVFLIVLMGWILPFQLSAFHEGVSHVKMELIEETETIQPATPFWVALHLELEKDWHVYWKNPGDAGVPLKIEWLLPNDFEAAPLQWPFPERFTTADMIGFGYHGTAIFLTQITPSAQLQPGSTIELQAKVNWLACSSLNCQPGSTTLHLPLVVSEESPRLNIDHAQIFREARQKIPQPHPRLKAIRQDDIIQLEMPQSMIESLSEIRGIDFFPEEQHLIDQSIVPRVDAIKEEKHHSLISLKGLSGMEVENQSLKGVLVVHKQQGMQQSVEAFDIDSSIENQGRQEILSFLPAPNRLSSVGGVADSSVISDSHASFAFEGGVGLALLFAFVGGMILNLMPCVLPVMSFKVMSFVKMAGQSRSLTFKHGLMFSLGVILSFWVLASVMLILRTYGQSVGWGFQLQEPLFVVILASVLFIFALSLFGLFEWGMFVASWAGQTEAESAQKSSGYGGSFFSGVLATAVATPCTGPFLGSAVGFAVTLPILQSLLIFTSLGFGMCFPYLLLAAFPSFLRFMPKPGMWMETFKQLMGFLLLATVLWLMWVFSSQTDAFSLICLLGGFLCFSIGAWIYGRGCAPFINRKKRLFAYACVALFAFMGVEAILFPRASWSIPESTSGGIQSSRDQWVGWEEFSPERVVKLREEGKPVLIDFTAKWCLICQVNHMAFNSGDVSEQLDAMGVVKMRADWTKNDPMITEALAQFGRNSVPLYVLYGTDAKKDPVILPQVLTPDIIVDHLNQAIPNDIALK
ncbi:MAG: protein-disulfide reductase DsbD family protein [Parachlamydiaceae bacterium]